MWKPLFNIVDQLFSHANLTLESSQQSESVVYMCLYAEYTHIHIFGMHKIKRIYVFM